jgi:general secretion pathway protein H
MGFVSHTPLQSGSPVHNRGFTLIELLLVLVILSVMYSMVALNLSGTEQARLDSEATRLQKLLQTLRQEALLLRSPAGLLVDELGYQGLLFNTLSREWEHDPRRLLRHHDLQKSGLTLTALAGVDDPGAQPGEPVIVFDSSGISEPFSLRLATGGGAQAVVTLVTDGVGELVRQ